jgi:hypothetical protein
MTADRPVRRELDVRETSPGTLRARGRESVLREPEKRIEVGIEVGLSDQRGVLAGFA